MTAEADTGRKTGTQAIERGIAILRLFARTDTPLTLSDVARAVDLNTTTTHRILATLVRERLLANDAASERYRIGPDSLLLFAAAARRYGIAAARSELEVLAEVTHETSALGVLDGDDAIMVLQVESDMPLRFSRALGTRIPWHVSAMGKADPRVLRPTTSPPSSRPTASSIGSPITRSSTRPASSPNSNRSANAGGRSTTTSDTTGCAPSPSRSSTPTSRRGPRSASRARPTASPIHASTSWSTRSGASAERLSLHLQITTF